jgi:hypothetical protein
MAITRIKNNQITDNTIEYQKLKDGTLVGTKFNANITLNSNVSIIGNLTVTGNTYTVNSTNTFINDPLVIFNNGYTGSPSYDVGVLVNRDLQPTSPTDYGGFNTAWIWREADGSFEGILTTETGNTQGAINRSAFANLVIGNTIIKTTATNPSVVEAVDTDTGALQVKGGASFTQNVQVGGSASVFGANTGQVAIDGNVPITQITQLSSTRYGLMITDTNNNGAFALRSGTSWGAQIHTFGGTNNDIYIQPDRKKSIWMPSGNAAVLIDNNINSTSANVGALIVTGSGGIAIGGNLNVGTAASFESKRVIIQAPATSANSFSIGSGTLFTGLGTQVTAVGTGIGATSIGNNSTIVGAKAGSDAPGVNNTLFGYTAGEILSGTDSVFIGYGAGKSITSGNYNVVLGNYDGNVIASLSNQVVIADGAGAPRIRIDAGGNVFVVSGLNSTNSNVGAFVVQGGAAVGGNLNVGGPLAINSQRAVLEATQTSLLFAGNTATTYLATDSVIIGQKIGSGTNFGIKTTIIGSEAANTNTNAADITLVGYRAGYSGAGQETTAVGSNAGLNLLSGARNNQLFGYNAGSQITTGDYNVVLGANTMTGLETVNNHIMLSDGQGNGRIQVDNTGVVTIYATTEATSPAAGALVVYGGIAIGANSYVGGNLTVTGNLTVQGNTTTINSQNLTVQDSIIELHTFANLAPLTADDGRDVGVRAHYYKGSDNHAFFGWQNSTENFVFIQDASESNGVHSGTYGNVQFGSLWLSNTTVSAGETSGALVVKGGIGTGALSYMHSLTVNNNLDASGTNALITFRPSGTGNVDIQPTTTTGNIDNMFIGQTNPQSGTFTVLQATQTAYLNPTGTVQINPTQLLTVNPGGSLNTMDNVYIGNTTPRGAAFTHANVAQDLVLKAFTSNSALFISTGGNLSVDQKWGQFNFQSATGNAHAGVSLSVGTNGDVYRGADGTKPTFNVYYTGDSYLPQSAIAANTAGQLPGWTVSTSRGTGPSPSLVQDGDFNGVYGAYAYTGTIVSNYKEIGSLRWVTQGDELSSAGIGGQAQLWTKNDNGSSVLALRVDANQISEFYGQVRVANTTTSTNTTTGALYVEGGMSTSGNLNVGLGMRVNDLQVAGKDFYVRGGNDATLIWGHTAAAYNQVLIGNSAVQANLVQGAKFQINSTDSMLLPVGTSGQRPSNTGFTDVAGMMRYNTIINDIEYYNGTQWVAGQGSSIVVVTSQQFSGNGVQTVFTLSRESSTNATLVTLNGVVQEPSIAYDVDTLDNVTLTFTEAPAVGDEINIRTFATTQTVSGLSSANGYVEIIADNSGIDIYGSTVAAGQRRVRIETDGAFAFTPAGTSVNTSATVVDSFDKAVYRSAKYIAQVTNGSNYETTEILVVHDGTTAYKTQYATINTGGSLGTFTAIVNGSNVELKFAGTSSGNTVKVQITYIAV